MLSNKQQKKLVLIEPMSPGFHIYSKMKLPRVGAVLLGTIMKNKNWDVRVYVEEIAPVEYKEVLTADVVGISTITSTATRAYAIADAIRQFNIPVIMGGPHSSFLSEETLEHCDYVIRGEGEEALPVLLDTILGEHPKSRLSEVPNLSYRDEGGRICHNPQTSTIMDLDTLPFPDYNLIAGWRFTKTLGNLNIVPIQASRGCPFNCNFCSVTSMFGKKMRFRSTAHIIDEIARYDNKNTHIFFYDDNFTANPKRTKHLLETVISKKMEFSWSAQVRTDVARDEELLKLIKETRCRAAYVGFESVNPESLSEMKKSQDVSDMELAIKRFNKYKIDVHGMFVFGFENDTKESIENTIRFAKKSGILSVQFLILTPLPGTAVFKQLEEENRLMVKNWALYDTHHVVFKPKNILPFDLQLMQIKGHASFYSLKRTLRKILGANITRSLLYLYARNLNLNWKKKNRIYLTDLELAHKSKEAKPIFDFKVEFRDIKTQVQDVAKQLNL